MNTSVLKLLNLIVPVLATAVLLISHTILAGPGDKLAKVLLLLPLIVSLAHTFFVEAFVRPYILLSTPLLFMPRPLRFQHALRRAILWWHLERRIGPQDRTLRYLDLAIGLSESKDQRKRCVSFRQMIAAGQCEAANVEAELLLAILPRSKPRRPALGLWVPIKRQIRTVALAITLIFALGYREPLITGSLDTSDITIMIAVCWLVWALGRFAYEVWFSWRLAFSIKEFSTLIVSDDDSSPELNFFARELYWRIGKVTVIHVLEEEEGCTSVAWVEDGSEHLAIPRDLLEPAISVLGLEVDLVVTITENMDLARQILDSVDLPSERRLVLNKSGTAPAGYNWIEQAAAKVDPARPELFEEARPSLTRYDRRMPGEGSGSSVNFSLLFSILVLWIPGGILISLILTAISGTLIWLREFAVDRRIRVSRRLLRAPRSPKISTELDPALLMSRLKLMGTCAAVVAAIPITLQFPSDRVSALLARYCAPDRCFLPEGSFFGLTGETLNLLVLGSFFVGMIVLYAAGFFRSAFVLIGMRISKWILDRDFRIVVFRRNSDAFGYALLASVMGTCGKYGQVLLLDHPSVQAYKTGPRNDHRGNTSHWSYYFAEPDLQIQMTDIRPDWQRTCLMELEFADFAVFDWSEEVTEAMKWELQMALLNLPPDRILIVLNAGVSAKGALALLPFDIRERVACRMIPRGRDDQYIWANHSKFDEEFKSIMAEMMFHLRPEPREIKLMGIRGVWPFPVS